jgi:hypothetical protein
LRLASTDETHCHTTGVHSDSDVEVRDSPGCANLLRIDADCPTDL